MAWIYLAESVVSQSHFQNGSTQSLIVSKTDMLNLCCCRAWLMVQSTELQYGTTLHRLKEPCYQVSTSSLEDSHAKTSALQDLERAWTESEVVFSSKLLDWSKKSSPLSSFWKTCQPLELAAFCKSSLHLQKSGMIVDGLVSQPQALVPYTKERGGFYWPTPSAIEGGPCPPLSHLPRMNQRNYSGKTGKHVQMTLRRAVTWENRTGKLNPQWVEWLMGFPIGWTELSVLGTQWFLYRQKKRLKC